ncbi:LysR family transcriptional regulator [Streptomyces zagrosensis]|uniref:DNA-binding transcriptional LysR family regulator n=1 Tax=Streptomyces zagrosensis TaxID=1042984 RepID=A0A7W9Q9J1_9ACTN|nr:LysR family transcriptional regulator [Streptomyces zagrosensis]MBB5935859.1 DNA-binding transcriptional LysR family regulator [Streptomyces zagrosensis]
MTLEIHDLRVLRAIADAGSLAGAARALGTNQGNISRQLQRIERTTGTALFQRGHHGTTPTAAGRLVLGGAETLLPLIDYLLDSAAEHTAQRDAPTTGSDTVRIGSVNHPLLPTIAGFLCTLLPDVSLGVHTDESSAALLDLLCADGLEAAVVRHFPSHDAPLPAGIDTAVIAHEHLLVGVGDHHRLAGRHSVSLRDLAPETGVLVDSRNSTLRRCFLAAIKHSGAGLRMSCAADEAVVSAMVCASSAALPAFPVVAPLPGVVYLPLDDDAARFALLLAWSRTGKLATHGARLAELARQAYSPASDS